MYLTVHDLAERLRCGVSTAYDLVRSGRIKSFRIGRNGGRIRISEEQLQMYLASVETGQPPDTGERHQPRRRTPLRHLRL